MTKEQLQSDIRRLEATLQEFQLKENNTNTGSNRLKQEKLQTANRTYQSQLWSEKRKISALKQQVSICQSKNALLCSTSPGDGYAIESAKENKRIERWLFDQENLLNRTLQSNQKQHDHLDEVNRKRLRLEEDVDKRSKEVSELECKHTKNEEQIKNLESETKYINQQIQQIKQMEDEEEGALAMFQTECNDILDQKKQLCQMKQEEDSKTQKFALELQEKFLQIKNQIFRQLRKLGNEYEQLDTKDAIRFCQQLLDTSDNWRIQFDKVQDILEEKNLLNLKIEEINSTKQALVSEIGVSGATQKNIQNIQNRIKQGQKQINNLEIQNSKLKDLIQKCNNSLGSIKEKVIQSGFEDIVGHILC